MGARARRLSGPATVYVSASPFLVRSRAWPARMADIGRRLPGVQFESYSSLFERHTEQYKDGWDAAVEMLDGLVVCLHGDAGPGLAREMRGAIRHRLPVLVASGDRLVPLVDCKIEPHPTPDRRRVLIITLPDPLARDDQRLTYRASLTALGVTT